MASQWTKKNHWGESKQNKNKIIVGKWNLHISLLCCRSMSLSSAYVTIVTVCSKLLDFVCVVLMLLLLLSCFRSTCSPCKHLLSWDFYFRTFIKQQRQNCLFILPCCSHFAYRFSIDIDCECFGPPMLSTTKKNNNNLVVRLRHYLWLLCIWYLIVFFLLIRTTRFHNHNDRYMRIHRYEH